MQRIVKLLFFAAAASAAEFSYNRCDKGKGPSNWPDACAVGANYQSPIDLCGASTLSSLPKVTPTGYATARAVNGLNNGHTIQINIVDNAPTLNMGNIAQMVGRSTSTNETWVLAQMHLHWGRTGMTNEGSEHYIQGKAYPLEAHFVHRNSKYADVPTAAANTDGLLVVGVLYTLGDPDNQVMQYMSQYTSSLTQTATRLATNVTLSQAAKPTTTPGSSFFEDGTGQYYAYPGSLTTPGCNAVVTWIVLIQTQAVNSETLKNIKAYALKNPPASTSLAKFAQQEGGGDLIAKYGNFRPLTKQPSPKVYISSGGSAACQTVTEPSYTCSGAFITNPSLWLVALVLSAWHSLL